MANDKKPVQRTRTKYTPEQLRALETVFQNTQYPDTEMMEELGMKMDVAVEKISIWFQNRRSKFKRQSKDTHVAWMRKHIFQQEQGLPMMQRDAANEKHHVLSPPKDMDLKPAPEFVCGKPTSNLHYIPSLPLQEVYMPAGPVNFCENLESVIPTDTYSGATTGYNAFQQKSLLLSHLMNDQQLSSGMHSGYFAPPNCHGQSMYGTHYTTRSFYPVNNTPYSGSYVAHQQA